MSPMCTKRNLHRGSSLPLPFHSVSHVASDNLRIFESTADDNRDSTSTPPHKRSKSGIARSLLSRSSTRNESSALPSASTADRGEEAEGGMSNPSDASLRPSTSKASPSHRPHLSTTMSNYNSKASLDSPARDPAPPTPSTVSQGASIEQSVRLFKVFEALRNGDTPAIAKALNSDGAGARLEGATILHLAIQCAQQPVIEFVLSQHAVDINSRDKDGNTPLHTAAVLGRAPIVKLLLEQANVNDALVNYQGKTPLDLARSPEIFQQLQLARSVYIDANVRKIHHMIARSDYDGLEHLLADARIRATLDVNGPELATEPATTESGGCLLHEAARKRDVKLAQILLLNGADPFQRDRKGRLPQDVTKDDRTRAILKKSPAAAAAQRSIQEKTVLGDGATALPTAEGGPGGKESREMKGYLRKWTNYTSGFKLRWFVLEDGVLSYYKHQDDAGSACRGAINMKIAKLKMDPKDKLLFEILGKSSVKYNLKANHEVEAKRWFWALNNAIQWAKDEEKEEQKRQQQESLALRGARQEQLDRQRTRESDVAQQAGSHLTPATAVGGVTSSASASVQDGLSAYEPSVGDDFATSARGVSRTATIDGDLDDDEEYGDDASSHEMRPVSRDAFSVTAQSAKLQLDLLEQVSAALKAEESKNPAMAFSHPSVAQALSSYETGVGNLKGLLGDLLRISRDHEAYWQARVERETNVRRLWEDSMARVAQEQEELESRIGESEFKRKQAKRALRDVLESQALEDQAEDGKAEDGDEQAPRAATPSGLATGRKATMEMSPAASRLRRETIVSMANREIFDEDDAEEDEQFFDAVDAGEVEVVDVMPPTSPPPLESDKQLPMIEIDGNKSDDNELARDIVKSHKGYEDGIRKRLKLDADNRPKASLWVSLPRRSIHLPTA